LHTLISGIDDRWWGPDNRKAFLKELTQTRLSVLDVDSRAALILALQIGATVKRDEQAIGNIIFGTHNQALTQLKNAIDAGGDYHDLQQLIFHDIDSPALREKILAHFGRQTTPTGQVKVLSDIDDTFYANLKDKRFPKKTVYPGVLAFYAELDKGGRARADRLGDLTFLSARPYDSAGLFEELTKKTLREHGVGEATVLSGDFAHLVGNQRIAEKKLENWQQYRQLFTEYQAVFIGDSGQGDALFGSQALASGEGQMKAVFIHNVTALSDTERSTLKKQGIYVFDTYLGAATQAYALGLITQAGLKRVAASAKKELATIRFTSPAQAAARKTEFERDWLTYSQAVQATNRR
ncbi:MAG: hypothetical protein K1X64_20265, partial [Myxococcaceae bacterium]|nr:hypothetical protein [Myxococcaceae bacterium]